MALSSSILTTVGSFGGSGVTLVVINRFAQAHCPRSVTPSICVNRCFVVISVQFTEPSTVQIRFRVNRVKNEKLLASWLVFMMAEFAREIRSKREGELLNSRFIRLWLILAVINTPYISNCTEACGYNTGNPTGLFQHCKWMLKTSQNTKRTYFSPLRKILFLFWCDSAFESLNKYIIKQLFPWDSCGKLVLQSILGIFPWPPSWTPFCKIVFGADVSWIFYIGLKLQNVVGNYTTFCYNGWLYYCNGFRNESIGQSVS